MNSPRILTISFVAVLLVTPLYSRSKSKKVAPQSRCSFAHYPVVVGDISEYSLTSTQLDAEKKVLETNLNTYSDEVTLVENDRFTTKSLSAGNASESEWICGDEGLEMKFAEYPDTTITSTGVSIPSKMEVGDVWNQTLETESPGSSQKSKTVNRVTKREKVVVPAGTFDAFRVDYEVETTMPEQEPSFVRGTQWFAAGVGIVKSVAVIDLQAGEIHSIETTIELVKRTAK